MCPAIDNPASCEIRAAIRFLHAKITSASENHRELCAVYGQNMSEGTVRQRCTMFKDGRKMFTMKAEVVGRPSLVSDDLVNIFDPKMYERGRFTVSEFCANFHKFQSLYKIITVG
jgi:hypothetical protein